MTSVELGSTTLIKLTGAPDTNYATFCPAIDAFLKGYLFGDIFGRDNLDVQSREIATISALATLGDANPQLQSHFAIGFNTGLTETLMRGLISVISAPKSRGSERTTRLLCWPDVLAARHTRHDSPQLMWPGPAQRELRRSA